MTHTNGEDRNVVWITILSSADRLGRRSFMAEWWANNIGFTCDQEGWRGQCFFGNVEDHAAGWETRGRVVKYRDGHTDEK